MKVVSCILFASTLLVSLNLSAKSSGLPGSFKGKQVNPCEIAFVKLLNGKIPAQARGDATLNLWDERFNPESIISTIKDLPTKDARINFLKDLKKLVHKDQDFVTNLSSTVNLMLERKLIGASDVKKLFVTVQNSKATFFYSTRQRALTGKLNVDFDKASAVDELINKFTLSKNLKKDYKDLFLSSNRTADEIEVALKNGLKLRNDAKSFEQLKLYMEFLDNSKANTVKKGLKQIEKIYNYNYKHTYSIVDQVLPVHKKFLAQKSRINAFETRRIQEIEQGFKTQMNTKYTKQLDDLLARKKAGEKISKSELAAVKKKIRESKLSKGLKKRALSQAKGEKSIFRKLMSGCGSGSSKRLDSARKKFMQFKFGVGLAGTPLFYWMKNKDKMETDEYWYEKLGYEWATSIIYSYAGGKIVTGKNSSFWGKYLKGFFGFRAMDAGSALAYDQLFGKNQQIQQIQKLYKGESKERPITELEKEFNELMKSPSFASDVKGLLAYLEEKSSQVNTKYYLDKFFNLGTYSSLESNKITQEDLETEEGKEMMMELLAERMYLQNMGDWPIFQTGNHGADRWSFYAARATFWDIKSLAFNLMLFQIMCKEPLGKVGSWGLVLALYLGDQYVSGDLTYGYRREAINQ